MIMARGDNLRRSIPRPAQDASEEKGRFTGHSSSSYGHLEQGGSERLGGGTKRSRQNDEEHAHGRRCRERRDDRGREERRSSRSRKRERGSYEALISSSSLSSSPSTTSSHTSRKGSPADKPLHPRLKRHGASPIAPSDYYLRSTEFRYWLLMESDRHHSKERRGCRSSAGGRLEDFSSQKAHQIFDSLFVPRWNEGRLPSELYSGKLSTRSLPTTSHKWAFMKQRSAREQEQVDLMKDNVESLTNGTCRRAQEARRAESGRRSGHRGETDSRAASVGTSRANFGTADSGWGRDGLGAPQADTNDPDIIGPSAPSHTLALSAHPKDARFRDEEAREAARRQEQALRRTARRELRELEEEQQELLLGRGLSSGSGREVQIERRKEQNRANREFEAARRGGDDDAVVSEDVLMGNGGEFQEALAAQRGVAATRGTMSRRDETREAKRLEREQEVATRRQKYRQKEDKTMQMLKDLAKTRFG